MKIRILFTVMAIALVHSLKAQNNANIEYSFGAGFNIGGTMPIGLPAEVREIGSYRPTANFLVGGYATKMFNQHWGARVGLRLERKGHSVEIGVRNYRMMLNIGAGDEVGSKSGYFTGSIKNTTRFTYLTLPFGAVYRLNDKWDFRIGAYLAYAIDRSFKGNVLEGHIRETPLTPIIGITQADYKYSDDLRRFDAGAELGVSLKVGRGFAVNADLSWGGIKTLNPNTRKIDMDNYNIYLNAGISYIL